MPIVITQTITLGLLTEYIACLILVSHILVVNSQVFLCSLEPRRLISRFRQVLIKAPALLSSSFLTTFPKLISSCFCRLYYCFFAIYERLVAY